MDKYCTQFEGSQFDVHTKKAHTTENIHTQRYMRSIAKSDLFLRMARCSKMIHIVLEV